MSGFLRLHSIPDGGSALFVLTCERNTAEQGLPSYLLRPMFSLMAKGRVRLPDLDLVYKKSKI